MQSMAGPADFHFLGEVTISIPAFFWILLMRIS